MKKKLRIRLSFWLIYLMLLLWIALAVFVTIDERTSRNETNWQQKEFIVQDLEVRPSNGD